MVRRAMSETTSPLAPGVVIAETYEIERRLGQGGMGEVWLAKHRRLAGKQVAIKVLHVDRQLPQEAVARFRREAEIAARLEHPNIVQVLDFNTLPTGQPYLVMEYLKGQSLGARAHGKALPFEQVAGIMRQVGAALQAAHRAGVVHRDLKPENIFLVPTALGDQVKVLDFGISKLADSNTVKTTESVLIGTPLYMSPEQALGHNKDITGQSDLFSLGSITFELLTGQAPFFADNIAKVVFRIAYERHPSLATLRPELPANVIAAVEHALEKEVDRRTPNIEAFVEELSGQGLVDVVQDESSGVHLPGTPVSQSMASGETRAPSGSKATPAPASPYAPSPALTASTISGRKVMVFMVFITVSLAAFLAKVRTDNWAERAVYRAGMVDAGWVMLEDGNFVKSDGGAYDSGVAAAVVDAGLPSVVVAVEVDAGSIDTGVVDAGVAELAVKPKLEAPPTEAEKTLLDALAAQAARKEWDQIWDSRGKVRVSLKTPGALRQGLEVLLDAECARSDNAQIMPVYNELRAVSSPAQLKQSKQRCIARYPDAASLW